MRPIADSPRKRPCNQGTSGGKTAGPVAEQVMRALVDEGYLDDAAGAKPSKPRNKSRRMPRRSNFSGPSRARACCRRAAAKISATFPRRT